MAEIDDILAKARAEADEIDSVLAKARSEVGGKPNGEVSAAFPRTAKAKGFGKTTGAVLLDALSLPGRAVAASAAQPINPFTYPGILPGAPKSGEPGTFTPEASRKFSESLADTKGKNLAGKIVRDPATAAALLAAPATGGASAWPVYARLAAQGGAAGLASAAAHQGENVLEGKPINPKAAAAEIAISALLPVAAKGAGEVSKRVGKGLMQTILKPSKFLQERQGIDMGDLIETLGSARPLKGSVSGMAKTAAKLESGLTSQYDDIVAANATKKIPVRGNLGFTRNQIENAFTKEAKYGDIIEGLRKGGDYWDDVARQQGSQGGWYELPRAVEFRKSLGRAGRYNINKDPRDLEGPAQFAREAYKNLTAAESRFVPELAPVKESLQKLYPLQEAVENARGRIGNNLFPGLTDNLSLNAAAQAQRVENSIPGLLMFLANRTLKAPQAATGAYRLGQTMANPGVIGEARKRAIERAIAQAFREDE